MKKNVGVFAMIFLSLIILPQNTITDIRKDLIGEWIYQFSEFENGQKRKIDYFGRSPYSQTPVYKIIFSKCNDEVELKYFNNPIIKNLRKKDILKNIKFQTFSDNIKVIDTYYPGTYYDSTTNHIGMDTYGLRYKYDENIYFINKDTFKMSGSSGEEKGYN